MGCLTPARPAKRHRRRIYLLLLFHYCILENGYCMANIECKHETLKKNIIKTLKKYGFIILTGKNEILSLIGSEFRKHPDVYCRTSYGKTLNEFLIECKTFEKEPKIDQQIEEQLGAYAKFRPTYLAIYKKDMDALRESDRSRIFKTGAGLVSFDSLNGNIVFYKMPRVKIPNEDYEKEITEIHRPPEYYRLESTGIMKSQVNYGGRVYDELEGKSPLFYPELFSLATFHNPYSSEDYMIGHEIDRKYYENLRCANTDDVSQFLIDVRDDFYEKRLNDYELYESWVGNINICGGVGSFIGFSLSGLVHLLKTTYLTEPRLGKNEIILRDEEAFPPFKSTWHGGEFCYTILAKDKRQRDDELLYVYGDIDYDRYGSPAVASIEYVAVLSSTQEAQYLSRRLSYSRIEFHYPVLQRGIIIRDEFAEKTPRILHFIQSWPVRKLDYYFLFDVNGSQLLGICHSLDLRDYLNGTKMVLRNPHIFTNVIDGKKLFSRVYLEAISPHPTRIHLRKI